MENPANRQNGKLFVREGALTGVIATLTMDCLSAVVHRLGLTASLIPNLIGRWFASILSLHPFHSDIAQSPAVRNETATGLARHYAIGHILSCFYIRMTSRLGWRPWQLRCALGYGVCTTAIPKAICALALVYAALGVPAHAQTGALVHKFAGRLSVRMAG